MESRCNNMNACNNCYNRSNMYPPNSNRNCGRRTIQDTNQRRMDVECVCKVTSHKNCYKDDPMTQLGNEFPPVMAYVPWQQWGELYDPDCGLMQGTIFKDLNYIFCGVRC